MATLIDVATPGPALAIVPATENTAPSTGSSLLSKTVVALTAGVANTLNQFNLFTLNGAGTYVVVGIISAVTGTVETPYLSTALASATNSWPVVTQLGGGTGGVPAIITAVIKVTASQIIYLNVVETLVSAPHSYGILTAVQIK